METGFYLYGIFPAPGPTGLALQGLDDQTVAVHPLGKFAFLYSPALQTRYLASRRNLLGHERVLEAAMDQGFRTLLPLQFGLVINGWDRVEKELITPYGAGLTQLFAKLDGQREVGVKVLWDSAQELEMLMAEDDQLRDKRDRLQGKQLSMDQVVQIGQEIEAAMGDRKSAIIETFQMALDPLVSEVVENDPLTDAMIYNAAFLIPWDKEPEISDAVEALDAQFEDRLRIRYNNFTAPYNFARMETLR